MKFASNVVPAQPSKKLNVIHFIESLTHVQVYDIYLFTGVELKRSRQEISNLPHGFLTKSVKITHLSSSFSPVQISPVTNSICQAPNSDKIIFFTSNEHILVI